jgi:Holliday junction resolvase RusA-like endonuclease
MSAVADVEHIAVTPHLAPVSIIIPGDPAGKGRPRFFRGRAVTPAKTRAYEAVIRAAGEAAISARGGCKYEEQPLRMRVKAMMPIPAIWSRKKRQTAIDDALRPTGKPDCDNIVKAVADALNGVVYRDDAQLVDVSIAKFYSASPMLIVEISIV